MPQGSVVWQPRDKKPIFRMRTGTSVAHGAKEISHSCSLKLAVPGSRPGFGKPEEGWAATARCDGMDITWLQVAVVFRTEQQGVG